MDSVEHMVKNRFNAIEKKIIDIFNVNSKAYGGMDASASEIGDVGQESEFNFKLKME